jgi:thiol-disulfide isomerase/thioredoxin
MYQKSAQNIAFTFLIGCGHCIKLKPIYEQLAEIFKNDSTCVIAEVNGDQNKDIIKQYGYLAKLYSSNF